MKTLKIFSASVITGIALLGSDAFLPDKVSAMSACPTASTIADLSAFAAATGGSCAGTPEVYGITVYKMGFCTSNPASGGSLSTPDYSSCSWAFENTSGEYASFGAGGTSTLGAGNTNMPTVGTYDYAVIQMSKNFKIKSKYGPFGDGNTYYTNGDSPAQATGNTTTTESDWATNTAPLGSFSATGVCQSVFEGTVSGKTLNAYLLSSTDGSVIEDTRSSGDCSGHDKVLGVASTSLTISDTTKSLTSTFTVTNNGTTFWLSDDGTLTGDSGPFSVTFTVE